MREILRDIRAIANGILPPALTDLGLEAAVTELTARMPFRVEFSAPRRAPASPRRGHRVLRHRRGVHQRHQTR
jgi:signal transduction histidine kinase